MKCKHCFNTIQLLSEKCESCGKYQNEPAVPMVRISKAEHDTLKAKAKLFDEAVRIFEQHCEGCETDSIIEYGKHGKEGCKSCMFGMFLAKAEALK